MHLAFIGGGVMAEAMIAGLLRHRIAEPAGIVVFDIAEERMAHLAQTHGVTPAAGAEEAVEGAEVVILAVKPQHMGEVARDLQGHLSQEQLVLSIAAGITLGFLTGKLDHASVVRAMPNTPAQIGEGITAWTETDQVSAEQHELAGRILGALGDEVYVDEEHYLDAVTAVSGSGPAYVLLVIEAMIDAGVAVGLARPLASRLVLQTVAGTAHFAARLDRHPAELRNMVTSPAGTTAAALTELERGAVRAAFLNAIEAAHRRSQELGG